MLLLLLNYMNRLLHYYHLAHNLEEDKRKDLVIIMSSPGRQKGGTVRDSTGRW